MKPGGVWKHAWGNGGRWLLVATAVFLVAVGILVATAVGVLFNDRYSSEVPPFHPFTFPTVQKVTTSVIHNGDPVEVNGARCSSATTPVIATGSYAWVSFSPSGLQFRLPTPAAALRPPGCQQIHFINPMPPEVVEINNRLFAEGIQQVQWQLQGNSTPIRPDGTLGTPALWRTSIFTVVP